MEASNVKAMRDALELCHHVIHCAIVADILRGDDAYDALNKSKAALAEPPRNCDVGTAVEQKERYIKFKDYIDMLTIQPDYSRSLYHDSLYWAQMPYEEGESDGSK